MAEEADNQQKPVNAAWSFRVVRGGTPKKATETAPRERAESEPIEAAWSFRAVRGADPKKATETASRGRAESDPKKATETASRGRAESDPKKATETASRATHEGFDIKGAMTAATALHHAYVTGSVFQLPEAAVHGDTTAMPPDFAKKVEEKRRKRGRSRMPGHKVRRGGIQVALSDEEFAIVQAFVEENGFSLSGWAREVLFAAMRKKIPPRHEP
jgi:hypothetical protein